MKIALRANEAGVFASMKRAVHIAEALLEQSFEIMDCRVVPKINLARPGFGPPDGRQRFCPIIKSLSKGSKG